MGAAPSAWEGHGLYSIDHGVRCVCPRCNAALIPPSALFACPCGQALRLAPFRGPAQPPLPNMPRAGEGAAWNFSAAPEHSLAGVYRAALLSRLPRAPGGGGGAEPHAHAALLASLDHHAPRGAPPALISMLPERAWGASDAARCAREDEGRDEAAGVCSVCFAPYALGDVLRTLPCIHHFHRECIDGWLASNRVCAVCRCDVTAAELG